jgi:hypothetical protein
MRAKHWAAFSAAIAYVHDSGQHSDAGTHLGGITINPDSSAYTPA